MTLWTLLTVFLIAWAVTVPVMNWKQQRKFDDSQPEIERMHQRTEELKRELEKKRGPAKGYQGMRLVSGDGDGETTG
jgi:Tfp pilus assembly protein PilO